VREACRVVDGLTPPVGGVRLAYSVRGSGPPVLMVMGLGVGRWGWDRQVRVFSRHFRVITYDHRGTGDSSLPDGDYGMPELVGDALRLLDFLGVERAHVVGVSMGGYIAQTLAIERPQRVDRLVLCSTSCGGPAAARPDPELWRDFLRLRELPSERAFEVAVRALFGPDFPREHPRLAAAVVRRHLGSGVSPRTFLLQGRACARFDESARVGRIRAPTLVCHGTADALCPVENARLLASLIPRARLVLYEGAGHSPLIERAREFNRDVIGFLGGP